MRHPLLAAVLCLSFSATVADAQLNLAWDECGYYGVDHKTFVCDRNTGVDVLYGSFIARDDLTTLVACEGVVDFQARYATLPPWWQYVQAGSCRSVSLKVAYDQPCANAFDYWGSIPGGVMGGFGYFYGVGSTMAPSYGRLKVLCVVNAAAATAITPGLEVSAFRITIDHQKTVGDGACAGCLTQMCIVFQQLMLIQPTGLGDLLLTVPANGSFVSFQDGLFWPCAYGSPVTPSTWGQVKSLYR